MHWYLCLIFTSKSMEGKSPAAPCRIRTCVYQIFSSTTWATPTFNFFSSKSYQKNGDQLITRGHQVWCPCRKYFCFEKKNWKIFAWVENWCWKCRIGFKTFFCLLIGGLEVEGSQGLVGKARAQSLLIVIEAQVWGPTGSNLKRVAELFIRLVFRFYRKIWNI